MSKAHYIAPQVPLAEAHTVRLGQTSEKFNTNDNGKFVKFTAESRYELCAAGDPIEAVVVAVDTATSGGYSIGTIVDRGILFVTADGLEATPGTGTIALGDVVVTGTVVARNTALTEFPRVCKATNQPGTAVTVGAAGADTAAAIKTVTDAALAKVADAEKNALHAWRVVSLGTGGVGTVGATIAIQRL
jgi:hypothetical protein